MTDDELDARLRTMAEDIAATHSLTLDEATEIIRPAFTNAARDVDRMMHWLNTDLPPILARLAPYRLAPPSDRSV